VESNKFRIHIKIDGRAYPLEIDRADEERYRIAAKKVSETVSSFRDIFRDNDARDILAMSAFQIALKNTALEESEDKSLFIDELKNLNDDISDFLKERKK